MIDFIETQTLMEKCLEMLHLKESFSERVGNILKELGEFCGFERVFVLEIENFRPANVYEWCSSAYTSCAEKLRELTTEDLCRENIFGDGTSVKIYPPVKAECDPEQGMTVHIGTGGMSAAQPQYLETTIIILADILTFMLRAERSRMQLEQSSYIDALTGVMNRNAFIKDMELSSFPSGQPAGVVQMSVNGIKELNDRNGRQFGDQVLVKTAQTLCGFLNFAKVYRVGGDEFIAIWKGVSGDNFTAEMRKIMVWQQQEQGAKCALGYQWASGYASLQELVDKAEARMYEDKKAYYRDAAIPTRYRQSNDKVLYFANADTLSRLLAEQRFSIYFQPKFSVADRSLIGSEALVRFVTDSGQFLPPDQFIPFLEDARLIDQVDFYMFEHVCAKIVEWIGQGKRVVPVSVNFSRYTVREPWFHDTLLKTWEKYRIPKKYVELEITESAEEGGGESLLDLLAKLRQDGFPVSIDDFGVKYANLSIFTNGDFSTLKVDRSLISDWENPRTREILRSLCDICQRTGVFMIAEGVELQEQLDFLKKINCKGVQGYLFSRPIPMPEYERLYLKEEAEENDLPLTDSINHNFRGFKVLYEPICNARTLQVEGAEAYLHFDPENGQKVEVEELMTSLLSSGHIVTVGMWALEQAISACSQWVKCCPEMVVNINVFSRQLCMPGFYNDVRALLDKYNLAPQHVLLELTEDRFALDDEEIRITLSRLQEMGVMIAADYFGTGYSSPDKLLEEGIDVVKIDQNFAKTLASNQFNRDLVNAIVCLCHQNSKRVCMEGVETVGEQRMIFLFNVDCIQGPFVSMPIDGDEFYRTFMAANCEKAEIAEDNQRKQLESNNDLLMLLMDAMPFCLNMWNRNAEILACNQETLRLFGSPNYKEFKDNFYEFSPEYQPDGEESFLKAKRLVTQAFEKARLSCFWTHCLQSGEKIPTEVSFARIPYLQDYVVVSYTRDMRAQLKTEDMVRKFSCRLQSILNATPLCLNLWNRKFENTMCNKAALELFGLSAAEEYTKGFASLSPERQPDGSLSSEAAAAKIQQAFDSGECQFRWMHCKPDGELIPAEITLVGIEELSEEEGGLVAGFTRDLRPQLMAEQAEKNAAQRIKAVLDAMPLACILWNLEGCAYDCNQAAVMMFGAEDKNDVITNFDQFLPERQPDGFLSIDEKARRLEEVITQGTNAFEWVYRSVDGKEIPCVVSMIMLHTDEGDVIVAYSQDLRELRETRKINNRLRKMAYYDWLTGSLSRARFMEDCNAGFGALCLGDNFALIIFDFDNFKGLNDTYGHEFGDIVLRGAIKKVSSLLPQGALLGRYGGDEFLIQVRDMEPSKLHIFIQTILSAVEAIKFLREGKMVSTSVSIGAAYWNQDYTSLEMLINQADQALYEAKRLGRNSTRSRVPLSIPINLANKL